MKVLSLSLDKSLLDEKSRAASRMIEYGKLVDCYSIITIGEKDNIKLSDKVKVFGIASNKLLALFKIYNLSKNLLGKEKYDIISVQDTYYLSFLGWLIAKKYKLGFEIQIHGWERFFGLRKMIAKFILPKAGSIRVVSQRLKRQLINEFAIDDGRITAVPIYSEKKTLNSFAGLRERDDNKFVFLTIGRLVSVKNIEMQIEAMSEIIKSYSDTELWIVGEGSEEKKLKKLVNELKIVAPIKFFGWHDNTEKYYSQADAFLLTSDSEGWGLVVIEAAAYKLPIIMTDVGCAGEIIMNGISGIVIPVGGKDILIGKMMELIQNKDLRKKLGENAKLSIENLPNKELTLKLYQKSWQIALKNKL